jgi:hypothetical protein
MKVRSTQKDVRVVFAKMENAMMKLQDGVIDVLLYDDDCSSWIKRKPYFSKSTI